tara:strand:+ start:9501 stop:10277 length:777 start_codon:yes stop_codon:yes gene_type:complete
VPSSLKLAEAFGDDLAILFVEAQGASKKKAEQFAWNQGWMATTAMWGNEQPLVLDTDKLPVCALLSSEGEVLLMGNPISLHKDIEDAIRLEIKRATKVSKDVPRSLHGAWKSFQKGDYEKAFQAAIEVELPGDDDAPAAVAMLEGFRANIATRIRGIEWRISNGYLLEAAERLEDLADSAEGVVEIESLLAPIQERLASDEMEPEFDAAKAFAKIETRLKKDGLEDKWLRQLEPFMKKHEGTLAAERADQLLRLSKIK